MHRRPTPREQSDPSHLHPNDRKTLAAYWRGRGVGEMGAERSFARITQDLETLGAPVPLIELARCARADEAKHGRWGRDWAVFFGHDDTSDPVAERTRELCFPGASAHENRILRIVFCAFLETVGCHVLRVVRPRIVYPALRENNRRHLADEVQHARVCWGYLFTLTDQERAMVRRFLPLLLKLLPHATCEGSERDDLDYLVPWGYLTKAVLRAGYQQALDEVIVPGLDHLGLMASADRRAA